MGSHHELIVEISVYGISFHVVEVSGVLLIILRGYRWLKVDWYTVGILLDCYATFVEKIPTKPETPI